MFSWKWSKATQSNAAVLLAFLPGIAFAQADFVQGDQCLFCHRNDIGPTWQKNAHGVAVRQLAEAPDLAPLAKIAEGVEYVLGSRNRIRFLKQEGYGKFAILSAQYDRRNSQWIGKDNPTWDKTKFAGRCAGCHATAVDPETKAFAEFGLDCYVCHGSVNLEHSNDTSFIWLSKKRKSDAKAVTSICASCHLRGGKSRSTGLPYAVSFVAGEDLFKDYEADFAKASDPKLNAGDRHVWRNVRDVLRSGSDVTCLNCHQVHANSTAKHRRVLTSQACEDCHNATGPKKSVKSYEIHSDLCEY